MIGFLSSVRDWLLFESVVIDIRIAAVLFFIATAQVRCAAKAKLHTCARVGDIRIAVNCFLFAEDYEERGHTGLRQVVFYL